MKRKGKTNRKEVKEKNKKRINGEKEDKERIRIKREINGRKMEIWNKIGLIRNS